MRNLKLSIIFLVIGLAVFFGIERLHLDQISFVDIQSFVYLLVVAAVTSVIFLPVFTRYPLVYSIGLWVGIYLLLKGFIFTNSPFMGGIYTYLTITEMMFVGVLVTLAYQVGKELQEFDKAVEFVTLASGGSKIPQLHEADDLIKAEMNRSRHYNRSLSIILASLEPEELQMAYPRFFVEAQEKVMRSYVTARLAQTIRKELRRMDMVLEDHDSGRVIVISPEVDDTGSNVVSERLSNAVYQQLGVRIRSGSASYPQMALTFDDLVNEAEAGMGRNGYLQFSDTSGVAD